MLFQVTYNDGYSLIHKWYYKIIVVLLALCYSSISYTQRIDYFTLRTTIDDNLVHSVSARDSKVTGVPQAGQVGGFYPIGRDERRAHWYIEEMAGSKVRLINRLTRQSLSFQGSDTVLQDGPQGLSLNLVPYNSRIKSTTAFSMITNQSDIQLTYLHDTKLYHLAYDTEFSGRLYLIDDATARRTKFSQNYLPSGASTALTRYDDTDRNGGNGSAILLTSDAMQAKEAFGFSSYRLSDTNFIEWTASKPGNGMILRFSLEDSFDGKGLQQDILISNVTKKRMTAPITLDSKYAWIYGTEQNETNSPAGSERTTGACKVPSGEPIIDPRRIFDHTRVDVSSLSIEFGDTVRISRSTGGPSDIWIDFIELEVIGDVVKKPSAEVVYDVILYGADPLGKSDSLPAVKRALDAALPGQTIYFPSGTYLLEDRIELLKDIKILGAGIWHTHLKFVTPNPRSGIINATAGFYIGGTMAAPIAATVDISNFYMTGEGTKRTEFASPFNSLSGKSGFGSGSVIDSVWWAHMNNARLINADNMRIQNTRVFDVLAGGIVPMNNTQNFWADNNIVRHANDDGIGSWTADKSIFNSGFVVRYNSIEFTSRAAGIGVFGGQGSRVYKNYIGSTLPSAHSSLRVTSTFPGAGFSDSEFHIFSDNEMNGNSGYNGEIHVFVRRYAIKNVRFSDMSFNNSHATNAILVSRGSPARIKKTICANGRVIQAEEPFPVDSFDVQNFDAFRLSFKNFTSK
jgi:hypothetical protein